ncbi:hypothetical protein V6Z12_A12G157400 [Gossypium hirsutum]
MNKQRRAQTRHPNPMAPSFETHVDRQSLKVDKVV